MLSTLGLVPPPQQPGKLHLDNLPLPDDEPVLSSSSSSPVLTSSSRQLPLSPSTSSASLSASISFEEDDDSTRDGGTACSTRQVSQDANSCTEQPPASTKMFFGEKCLRSVFAALHSRPGKAHRASKHEAPRTNGLSTWSSLSELKASGRTNSLKQGLCNSSAAAPSVKLAVEESNKDHSALANRRGLQSIKICVPEKKFRPAVELPHKTRTML
eukprot:TRINITY_DN27315_c0_g1_i1.p1 TRINITY_DN27315_c0_g1~~TRINITY_DN27315_c0_g1_i1.p1  ORF type:complete len:214 (+),score=36.05 TRINITY_DN27315_c0_g1_i1:35-676(+)